MFRPNWPSLGVDIVTVKDSAAHCNVGFFPSIVVASGYFGYVGYHQLPDVTTIEEKKTTLQCSRILNHNN
jgi:hypothetical protein